MDNQNYEQPFKSEQSLFDNQPQLQIPNNNLPLAIVSTVLGCCSPCFIGFILGIIAIVFSTQVNTKFNAGDITGAQSAAKNAKILAFIALALFALNLIYVIISFATGGGSYYQEYLQRLESVR